MRGVSAASAQEIPWEPWKGNASIELDAGAAQESFADSAGHDGPGRSLGFEPRGEWAVPAAVMPAMAPDFDRIKTVVAKSLGGPAVKAFITEAAQGRRSEPCGRNR